MAISLLLVPFCSIKKPIKFPRSPHWPKLGHVANCSCRGDCRESPLGEDHNRQQRHELEMALEESTSHVCHKDTCECVYIFLYGQQVLSVAVIFLLLLFVFFFRIWSVDHQHQNCLRF